MTDLKGKRLLILGASGFMHDAIETAKAMGIYTIVTDYTPGALVKKYADKSYDVSTTDIDALERIARKEKIDGVFTGFSDVNLYSARELCDRLGLPFYATKEQLDLTTNKVKFKEMCRKYGVPTVPQYELDERLLPEHLKKIKYPVIVKPADSYGSKGISVCYNESELPEAVTKALDFSKDKQIIVEKYMSRALTTDHHIDYFFADGVTYFDYIGERLTNTTQEGLAPLTQAVFMPGPYTDEYVRDVDWKAKRMFSELGIRDGKMYIQAFHDDDGFYFYEMGYRLGGTQYLPVKEEYDVDLMKAVIHYALTGTMGVTVTTPVLEFQSHFCEILVLCSAGKISRVDGLDEARQDSRVVKIVQLKELGETVVADGTQGQQVFCRILIKETSPERLEQAIYEIGGGIVIYDENDEPMMLQDFAENTWR